MNIQKISLTPSLAAQLLPPSAALYISQPGTHVFAALDEKKEKENLSALAVVTYVSGGSPSYILRFISCEDEMRKLDCVALVSYIEELCRKSRVNFFCKLAGDGEYLEEAGAILEAAGYIGEDTGARYLEYDASQFMISPLGALLAKASGLARKLKGYDAYSKKDLAAFSRAVGMSASQYSTARYFSKDGKIKGMLIADNTHDSTIYVKSFHVIGNDPRTLFILLSYAVTLALKHKENHSIIFEAKNKALIKGLIETLGEPYEDTWVRMYKKA